MPTINLKFKSMASIWRVKGTSLATIEEDNVEKVRKDPTTYYPSVGYGSAEGGLYSSGYHDGTALYSNSDGLHSAQSVRAEGWVSSSPAAAGVYAANIMAGGIHEIAHNIAGTAPPVIETVAASYSSAYIYRSYKIDDPNEAAINIVQVRFEPYCVAPSWQFKRPVHGFKMLMRFQDTWHESIYDDALYSNQGGWHIRHKLRGLNGNWIYPGDHIFSETRQTLTNYAEQSYYHIPQGQMWTTEIMTNDFTFVTDPPANGNYVTGRSAGVSGAAPQSTGDFRPQAKLAVEIVFLP